MKRAELARILGGEPHLDHRAKIVSDESFEGWTQEFIHATAGRGPVFLANPDWGSAEQEQFNQLSEMAAEEWNPENGWLLIPTGGSSGEMKLARHDQDTLLPAITGAAQHLRMSSIHSLDTLPRHHVGGLMAWLRSVMTGGTFLEASWRRIAEGGFPRFSNQSTVVSLVPTQLQRLKEIEGGATWLKQFEAILVGGAALDKRLAKWARSEGIRLCPTYGATETAAMACAGTPDGFLAGSTGVGRPLPHIQAEVGRAGELRWKGASMFRGYWPNSRPTSEAWSSGDLGEIDGAGEIHIHGRADGLINSGGEKVNPLEVEEVLAELLPRRSLKVLGIPHEKWGESVVLAYADGPAVDLSQLWAGVEGRLAKFKWPKYAVRVEEWPINAMGKINTRQLIAKVSESREFSKD